MAGESEAAARRASLDSRLSWWNCSRRAWKAAWDSRRWATRSSDREERDREERVKGVKREKGRDREKEREIERGKEKWREVNVDMGTGDR